MLRRLLPGVALLISAVASAQTAYITDVLRLGIHAAPDTSDQAFATLVSGTAVEVLERNTNYARVKLADGREGWVRATYLVTTAPAAARIAELEGKLAELEGAVTAAKGEQLAAEQELGRVTAQFQAETGSTVSIEETLERLTAENRAYEERFETYRHALPLTWVVVAGVVVLVAGFLAGLWWLDSLIRRRHGGFRVY
jgi:SH3 domain protein